MNLFYKESKSKFIIILLGGRVRNFFFFFFGVGGGGVQGGEWVARVSEFFLQRI